MKITKINIIIVLGLMITFLVPMISAETSSSDINSLIDYINNSNGML